MDTALAYEKLNKLKEYFRELGSAAIAFSGGVDSTLLLKVAVDVLGDRAVALTAHSKSFPSWESEESTQFCKVQGIRHVVIESEELKIEGIRQNPKNRCYICKKALFQNFINMQKELGLAAVCEGSNMDDLGDYRPGLQAIKELEIKSPLREAGLYKEEIRFLLKEMGIAAWDKPSYACLMSRFAYGETITEEKLAMVGRGEEFLMQHGFRQMRVRIHGTIARIEVLPEDMGRLLEIREEVYEHFKKLGFSYISMDLKGFRSGSMNETIVSES